MRILFLAATALLAVLPAVAQTKPQTGPFPPNSVTDRINSGPKGSDARASIRALQQTLTPPVSVVAKVMVGGALVLAAGILNGSG